MGPYIFEDPIMNWPQMPTSPWSVRYSLKLLYVLVGVTIGWSPLQADERETTFRVVSYNIKHGLGNDGKIDLARTAQVIRKLEPDFVGLQEVDENTRRSGNVDQAEELGLALKMEPAFGAFMDYDGGRYGMAVLSRHPIQKLHAVQLPEGNEPRIALAVEVASPQAGALMLINVHFDWVRDDKYRFAQAVKLREYLDSLTIPYILLGDFNDQRESRTLKLLSQGTLDVRKPREDPFTFSAQHPKIEIDFIFSAPASRWTAKDVAVVDEPLASDHRPVFATLHLDPAN